MVAHFLSSGALFAFWPSMPRKNLVRSPVFPYHVTARVNNREAFPIPLFEMWSILNLQVTQIALLYGAEVHALVMMPNHFHLLMTLPDPEFDLGKVMNRFMCDLTLECHRYSGRSGRLFGKRYHWSIIRSSRYYGHVFKYIYRNPVKANLSETVEEYEFSTLRGLLGHQHLSFPIFFTRCGLELNIPEADDHYNWLEWLNRPFVKEAEVLIQKSLRKKEIEFLLCPQTRRPELLLEGLI